jgi:MFS family permease
MFTGTSIGGMIMNPVNTLLVQTFGWRKSYIILGITMSIVAIPLILLLIRTRPSEMNLTPDGVEPTDEKTKPLTGQTLGQAVRTPAFWFIAANMFLINFMANSIGQHAIPYLTDIGHSEMTAGIAFGAAMGCMAMGALSFGFGADRWGARQAFVFSCIMTAAGLGALMFAKNYWLLAMFVFLFGFPQGGPLPLTPLVTADCHGLANLGAIYGAQTLFSIFGAAIGPIVIGRMYDVSHSYQGALVLMIVLTLMGGYCIYRARPVKSSLLAPSKTVNAVE